jgi:5-methylcytosine-specific restriction endonuclease McrA
MKTIEKECLHCKAKFNAELKEHKRGNAKFCSRACSYAFRSSQPKKPKEPNCECAHCGTKFYKTPSKMRNSKSGLFFCTRKCKDEAQRIGGTKEIMPSHYGKNYRTICFNIHKKECVVCGENKIVAVHHYDHNHYNNEPSNLIPLCPTHHHYVHSKYEIEVKEAIDEWRNNYLTSHS